MTISNREGLVHLLTEASELEHGLCCCYLFAAFSLRTSPDEGLTDTELEAVLRWERVISAIAVQEMLHLALASNMLTAIGASPHFRRPNFPQGSRYYPPDLQLTLRRFDDQALDHFIFIERPEGMDIPDASGIDEAAVPASPQPDLGLEPVEPSYSTVGDLYREIGDGFEALANRLGEQRLFVGPPKAQATSRYFPFPHLDPVTDLASALKTIELIVEQGEGLRGDIEDSHYGRFLAIRGELDRLRARNPGFEPARPVMENPFCEPPADSTGCNLITHPDARGVSELFDASYGLMLEMLMRFFAHTEESHEELVTLIALAIGIMRGVIKPLGTILTLLPATTDDTQLRAGPSFTFRRSLNPLPHRDAAWALFDERFEELAETCTRQAATDTQGLGLSDIATTIEALAERLRQHRRMRHTGSQLASASPSIT